MKVIKSIDDFNRDLLVCVNRVRHARVKILMAEELLNALESGEKFIQNYILFFSKAYYALTETTILDVLHFSKPSCYDDDVNLNIVLEYYLNNQAEVELRIKKTNRNLRTPEELRIAYKNIQKNPLIDEIKLYRDKVIAHIADGTLYTGSCPFDDLVSLLKDIAEIVDELYGIYTNSNLGIPLHHYDDLPKLLKYLKGLD
ncbi:MAG: hypothetical protein PHP65_02860 [Bacilli bacterium]|nr:hypothetical protein [Bacilli bacterium]